MTDEWDNEFDESVDISDADYTIPCPNCGEEIFDDLEYCPYCNEHITVDTRPFSGKTGVWRWLLPVMVVLLVVAMLFPFLLQFIAILQNL